jgi:hypothetical protein
MTPSCPSGKPDPTVMRFECQPNGQRKRKGQPRLRRDAHGGGNDRTSTNINGIELLSRTHRFYFLHCPSFA